MQQWRRDAGNIASDLIGPRYEPSTFCSKNERVTIWQTGGSHKQQFQQA